MQEYCESLEKFEKVTFINIYLEAIVASDVLSSEFTKMTMKINKPTSECTLHEVRKTTEVIAEKANLQSYSVGAALEGSVQLELGFPASCVGWILGVFTQLPSHTSPVRRGPRSTTPLNFGLASGEVGMFTSVYLQY